MVAAGEYDEVVIDISSAGFNNIVSIITNFSVSETWFTVPWGLTVVDFSTESVTILCKNFGSQNAAVSYTVDILGN